MYMVCANDVPIGFFTILRYCSIMSLKFLFLGEITGRAGIAALKNGLKELKADLGVDFTIANAEGTTNGFGLGKAHSAQLMKLGVDLLTGGEKLYYKVDLVEFLPRCPYILRPANYPQGAPGRPFKTVEVKGRRVAIADMISSSGFDRISPMNPFTQAPHLVGHLKEDADIVLLQFHSGTTAECATMGHFLDGQVAAVIGTHSKVLTADAMILPKGTAFISDNGRCGSTLSVGGFAAANELRKFITAVPERSHEAWEEVELQGALVTVNEDTGLAESIEAIRRPVKVERPVAKEAVQ